MLRYVLISFLFVTLAVDSGFAMMRRGGSAPDPSGEQPSKQQAQDVGRELLKNGYFVHVLSDDPVKSGFKLEAVSCLPLRFEADNKGELMSKAHTFFPDMTAEEFDAQVQVIKHDHRPDSFFWMGFLDNPADFHPHLIFTMNNIFSLGEGLPTNVVLLPISAMEQYIVNLHPTRALLWHPPVLDYRTIPGAILVTPSGYEIPDDTEVGKLEVVERQGPVDECVRGILTERSGGVVETTPAQEGVYPVATFKGVNVLDPAVFADFFESHPWVSFSDQRIVLREGIGSMIDVLGICVAEFNKFWRQGVYAQPFAQNIQSRYIQNFKVESMIPLFQSLLMRLEEGIQGMGQVAIIQDFETAQKPKVVKALKNFMNYVVRSRLTSKAKWDSREHCIHVLLRIATMPYPAVQALLKDKNIAPVKEELEVIYWFVRYMEKFRHFQALDHEDELQHLPEAVAQLRAKMDHGLRNWMYVECFTALLAVCDEGQSQEGFHAYLQPAIDLMQFIFPRSGVIHVRHLGGKMDINSVEYLRRAGFEFPEGMCDADNQIPNGIPEIAAFVTHGYFAS